MQPQPPSQRPLAWWRRGLLWLTFVGSVLGLAGSVYAATYLEIAMFGAMLSLVLFLTSGFMSYLALFPRKLTLQYQDFSHNTSNIVFSIFGVGVLALGLTLWWGPAIA